MHKKILKKQFGGSVGASGSPGYFGGSVIPQNTYDKFSGGSSPLNFSGSKTAPAKTSSLNMGSIAQGVDIVSSLLPPTNNDPTTQGINKGYDAAADALLATPTPWTQIAGGAMKVGSMVNKGLASITGGATTIKNPGTTADKILSSDLFALGGVGLVNSLTKSKVAGSNKDLAKQITHGYTAESNIEGAEFGGISKLFGARKKMEKMKRSVNRANTMNALKSITVKESDKDLMASQASSQDTQAKNVQALQGGISNNRMLSAKLGTKLLQRLKKGGTIKQNVIPSGALHSRKHNLEGDIVERITTKGIPVVSIEAGGVTQHAEIEREEIIFYKELTNKLEALLKKHREGDKEAAKEAGKLLSYEILENTVDNVGLTETIE